MRGPDDVPARLLMATKSAISVEEYLRTSFEDGDCDYVDGEVIERNVGERTHSLIQKKLILLLARLVDHLGMALLPEIRVQISPRRFRVADIAVWREDEPGEEIPRTPPFLAIEILSPEDRMSRMVLRISDYLTAGIEYVWVIDPYDRVGLMFSKQSPIGVSVEVLRTENPTIEIPLETVLTPPD